MMRRSRSGWTSLVAVAVLIATFVAGGLMGGAVVRILDAGEAPPPEEPRPGRVAVFAGEGPLSERLDLSEEQRRQIEGILLENRQKAALLLREMQPLLRARYDSTYAAIRAVLTPEQQAEFQRIREDERERIRVRFGPGWGDSGGQRLWFPRGDTTP